MIRTLRAAPLMFRNWKTSPTRAVKLPKFGPKLFGTTDPSIIATSILVLIAAHTAWSLEYAGSRACNGSSGVQSEGTPMSELLCWTEEPPFGVILRRTWEIPCWNVMFEGLCVVLYVSKAESQFGIGTKDEPRSWKPPLSR